MHVSKRTIEHFDIGDYDEYSSCACLIYIEHSLYHIYIYIFYCSLDSESLSWWRKRPNSAHLYLKDWDRTRLHWTDSENTGSAFSNLKIQDRNKLLIEEKGLYFIYATTVFDFTEVDEVPQVYYNITSYWPKLPHFRSFLLMGKYGGSRFSSKRHTGYLSGMAELYPGHQIKVSVNDHRFIDATPYTSFFGLFKL